LTAEEALLRTVQGLLHGAPVLQTIVFADGSSKLLRRLVIFLATPDVPVGAMTHGAQGLQRICVIYLPL
jgi:hypothetical protein